MGARGSTAGRNRPEEAYSSKTPSSAALLEIDVYPIRLLPEQSVRLYGFLRSKSTLTWRDVLENEPITLSSCVMVGISTSKLQRMQPIIKEWIINGKATLHDCEHMDAWKPNPFLDLNCSIGDLVLYRRMLTPKLLLDSGITFTMLEERYGLTHEIMFLLKYSTEEWLQLGIRPDFLRELQDDHWHRIFGAVSRQDLLLRAEAAATTIMISSSSFKTKTP